jgi:CDGSH-type Zn-finger protein
MKPKIQPLPNGPYYLINDMQPKVVYNLHNFKGEPLSTIVGTALCRCGGSKNKPFCDGTHSVIGFSSANKTLENDDIKKIGVTILEKKLLCMIIERFAHMQQNVLIIFLLSLS